MVLHLLGKKSWNVYNQENIARVRRDEAEAKAREEEHEQRIQEADAEKRIQILRGLRPSTSPPPSGLQKDDAPTTQRDSSYPHRKRRRVAGENDTDRDIRFAKEDVETAEARRNDILKRPSTDAPLMDETGHISLFPEESSNKKRSRGSFEKHPEVEAEEAKKKREYEDQYTTRFSNAAGFKQSMEKPWYSSATQELGTEVDIPSKDVWGNEDPRRREREKQRMDASDPLAAMKKGVRQLRGVEEERKRWNEERRKELESLKKEDKDSRHYRRRRRSSRSHDSLEDFSLDVDSKDRERRHRRHHTHRRHRDRSRERNFKGSSSRSEKRIHRDSRGHDRSDIERSRRRQESPGWTQAPGKRYSTQFAGL